MGWHYLHTHFKAINSTHIGNTNQLIVFVIFYVLCHW
ncbi:hypothetical protein F0521_40730 [Ferrimonas sp. YFM]|nr:hypothetical protein F0521_40730 [Ferrimonas sp. YFM]